MDRQNNIGRFLDICKKINRDGIDDLLHWLEWSDFFTAPASTRFHLSEPGGLLEHSLNVYDNLIRLLDTYKEIQVSEETAAICALFHDLCKVNVYRAVKRNKKDDATGKWVQYDSYEFDEKLSYGGHGSKSVFIIQKYIDLTPEEAVAINCHMSAWGDNRDYVSKAYEQFPFAWLLSVADQASTYVTETSHEK